MQSLEAYLTDPRLKAKCRNRCNLETERVIAIRDEVACSVRVIARPTLLPREGKEKQKPVKNVCVWSYNLFFSILLWITITGRLFLLSCPLCRKIISKRTPLQDTCAVESKNNWCLWEKWPSLLNGRALSTLKPGNAVPVLPTEESRAWSRATVKNKIGTMF